MNFWRGWYKQSAKRREKVREKVAISHKSYKIISTINHTTVSPDEPKAIASKDPPDDFVKKYSKTFLFSGIEAEPKCLVPFQRSVIESPIITKSTFFFAPNLAS